jgi:NADH-quinone oxidoreductase subunit L
MKYSLLFGLYLSPLLGCLLFNMGKRFSEKTIINISLFTSIVPFIFSIIFTGQLFLHHSIPLEIPLVNFTLVKHHYNYTLWIDHNSIVFLFLTHILAIFVIKYSYTYLNLEKGFQRFFSTIQLFIFGMYVLSLAGSLDIFFAGWEIVGLSSFLLIAFYRAHNRSLINAWRVFNIYRVCDLGLLIGAVISQAFYHDANRFSFISQLQPADLSFISPWTIFFLSFFMIFASVGKSAQFPFYNWPSRAMEGPTPSSAIFYGALSIHAGVFLLLRTYPLWSYHLTNTILVGIIGLTTFVLSKIQSKVQANIKGQIAYSITAQIGIMFIELSLGFTTLVLIHLMFHALYRCFQLLVSPSIVLSSLTNSPQFQAQEISVLNFLPKRLKNTLYILASTEFNFDNSWRGFHFLGWKNIYNYFNTIAQKVQWYFVVVLLIILIIFDYKFLPMIFPIVSIFLTLVALIRSTHAFSSLFNIFIATTVNFVGIYYWDKNSLDYTLIYLIPWFITSIITLVITYRFRRLNLSYFHALGTEFPYHANSFFICFILLSGMPFSPIFLAEDIILEKFIDISFLSTFSLVLNFMAIAIIYSKNYIRLFMGRTMKSY